LKIALVYAAPAAKLKPEPRPPSARQPSSAGNVGASRPHPRLPITTSANPRVTAGRVPIRSAIAPPASIVIAAPAKNAVAIAPASADDRPNSARMIPSTGPWIV
jgi:hypothetical protein